MTHRTSPRAKEQLKSRGASKSKAIPIRRPKDGTAGQSSTSGSKSRLQPMKDFFARTGSAQTTDDATPEESTISTADTDTQQGSHSGGSGCSSDDKQLNSRNYLGVVSDCVRNFFQSPSEIARLRYPAVWMQPQIRWLNHQSQRFLTIDAENYSLYELQDRKDQEYGYTTVASCPVVSYGPRQEQETLRCFALDNSRENNVALGFSNGRIQLARADIDATDRALRGDEIRDTQKAIACLAWAHNEPKLAAAYERGRAIDHTVVVYDLPRNTRSRELPVTTYELSVTDKVFGLAWFTDDPNVLAISSTKQLRFADVRDRNIASSVAVSLPALGLCTEPNLGWRFAFHSRNVVTIYDRRLLEKPVYEIAIGAESQNIQQLEWQPRRQYSLTCTLRDSGVLHNLAISRDAYCVDEHWDRNSGMADPKHVVDEIAAQFKYADIVDSVPAIKKVNSFSWHPSHDNKIAVLSAIPRSFSASGSLAGALHVLVTEINRDVDCTVSSCSDVAIAYSPYVNVVHKPTGDAERHAKALSSEEADRHYAPDFKEIEAYVTTKDLGWIMHDRAERGYGYVTGTTDLGPVIQNAAAVIEADNDADEDLRFCWAWIQRMYVSPRIQDLRTPYHTSFPGVQHVIKDIKSISSVRQDDVTYRNRVFTNDKRDHVLRLCGWPVFSDTQAFKDMFEALLDVGTELDMARAAALAIFSVQGWLCKDYLSRLCEYTRSEKFIRSNKHDYVREYQRMASDVYDALLSFDGIKVRDYEKLCSSVKDHYLLAIVKFLARREGYNIIQNEIIALQNLELEDKLAFAAIHMDDEQLNLALVKLMDDLANERRYLTVLTITGLDDCEECHGALQNYVEHTMDVQTATLLLAVGNCFRGSHVFRDHSFAGVRIFNLLTDAFKAEKKETARARSIGIVAEYIRLLDLWCMWNHRTFISHIVRGPKPGTENDFRTKSIHNQVVIACAYCGVPIYPSVSEKTESLRPQQAGKTLFSNFQRRGGRARMMQCSNCRKPLPKCTICRRHMGSQLEPNEANSSVDHWFVWCCGCNHGGHLAHIRHWFSEYSTCPASGCSCLCMERDYRLKDEVQPVATFEDASIFVASQQVRLRLDGAVPAQHP